MQIIPIRLLPPELLVAHNLDDFPSRPAVLRSHGISLGQDVAAALDPDGVAEALGELEDDVLLAGHLAGVEVVSLGLQDAHDGLRRLEGVGRSEGLLRSGKDVSLRFTHGLANLIELQVDDSIIKKIGQIFMMVELENKLGPVMEGQLYR